MADSNYTPDHKQCSKCGETKSLICFYRHKRHQDGRTSICKPCSKPDQKARYEKARAPNREANRKRREAMLSAPTKRCYNCGKVKDKTEFMPRKIAADGYRSGCRDCHREFTKTWRKLNPVKNREIYTKSHKKRHSSASYRLNASMRAAICETIRRGKGGRKTFDLLGYTLNELMAHLERQFLKGMRWGNYGEWHIDHIKPLSSFKIAGADDPELMRAWGLTNLRPIWAKDNISKGCKITHLI